MATKNKADIRRGVHSRIRKKVRGSAARPRLAVFRSLNHIYAQLIDDDSGKTLATAYSARASDYAGVSTPLAWKEVFDGLDPREFTIVTAPARFETVGDLWAGLRKSKPANLEAVFRKYA